MPVWRSLTFRGKTMLVSGVVLTALVAAFDIRGLLPVTLLLATLPLLALVATSFYPKLSAGRAVNPSTTQRSTPAQVSLDLYSRSVATGILSFADRVPAQLGNTPRFEAHSAFSWERQVTYQLPADHRGVFEVGPVTLQLGDPLGLSKTYRQFEATNEVQVTPRVIALPKVRLTAGSGTTGEESPHRIAISGHDDALVREHRHGDDLRRVHWRSTAKQGKLMVRREEQSWDPSVCVLLDSRATAYPDDAAFEWAVDAAASISLHLVDRGFRVSLVTAAGAVELPSQEDAHTQRGAILLELTKLQPSQRNSLDRAITGLPSPSLPQTVFALLGRVSDVDAARLTRSVSTRSNVTTFHLDNEKSADSTRRLLTAANWRVVPVSSQTPLQRVWGS